MWLMGILREVNWIYVEANNDTMQTVPSEVFSSSFITFHYSL